MHSWGLVHRDIKPANLLLKEELWEARPVLKLADFGLAARCAQGGCLKGWGTVPYMSPEQLLGYCNESCDMWACGCVFAEMLLGEILVPQACWGDNAKALKHLRSGGICVQVVSRRSLILLSFVWCVRRAGQKYCSSYSCSSGLVAWRQKTLWRRLFFSGQACACWQSG